MADPYENRRENTITIDDVDTCIRVLQLFIEKMREAESVISSLVEYRSSEAKSLEEKIAQMVLASRYGNQNTVVSESSPAELTEEEKKRIEELKKRYSGMR